MDACAHAHVCPHSNTEKSKNLEESLDMYTIFFNQSGVTGAGITDLPTHPQSMCMPACTLAYRHKQTHPLPNNTHTHTHTHTKWALPGQGSSPHCSGPQWHSKIHTSALYHLTNKAESFTGLRLPAKRLPDTGFNLQYSRARPLDTRVSLI